MATAQKKKTEDRKQMSGIERLSLRVSNMINHPIAQDQRWVTIHRLDTDGEREWEEVVGVLSETDGINLTYNDEDLSVTLKWEDSNSEDLILHESGELLVVSED